MFTYIRLPSGFWKWTRWTLLGISVLAAATVGLCYFLENYDPDYPWSGALGRSLKAKGVWPGKYQHDGDWWYSVVIHLNNPRPAENFTQDEIDAIAGLKRIKHLHITGTSAQSMVNLLDTIRETESTSSIVIYQTALDDASVDVLNKFTTLNMLSLQSQPSMGRVLARLENPAIRNLSVGSWDLDDEAFTGLNPQLRLETLSLFCQNLTGERFDKVAALRTLKKLNLRDCAIEGDALVHLKDHPHLESLSLCNLQISGRDLREIKSNKILKTLYLEGRFTANSALKAVGDMESLETLILMSQLGTEKALVHLKGAKSLKVLHINLPVTEVGIRHLAEVPRLEEFKAHVRLTKPVIRELTRLKNLKVLDPDLGPPFPAPESELGQELRAAIPHLRVNRIHWREPS